MTGPQENSAGAKAIIRVSAPASLSNLGPGFDAFGVAIHGMQDVVFATGISAPEVRIAEVRGDGGRLPSDARRNAAGAAALAALDLANASKGVEIRLSKGIPLCSGLGGSGASAAAGAVAADRVLGGGLSAQELLLCALQGEEAAAGSGHPDNVAPALLGGFVAATPGRKPRIVSIPTPSDLVIAVVHPHLERSTQEMRRVLDSVVPLEAAVRQSAHAAGLVAGLFTSDWKLISECTQDALAEPARGSLIPGLRRARAAALEHGAEAAGISGAGPSLFAYCRGSVSARRVKDAMMNVYRKQLGLGCDGWTTKVNPSGAMRSASLLGARP